MEKESVPTKVSQHVRTRNASRPDAQYIYFGDDFTGVTDAQKARETRRLFQTSLEDHMLEPPPIGLKLQLTPEDILNAGERTKKSPTKASVGHFPATSLTIGDFHIVATCEADLMAKCFYEKRKFVWEVLDKSRLVKYKIEVLWENILTMRADIEENRLGILQIELDKQPTFFYDTDPKPRKHPNWELSKDFTIGGHASIYRRHYLEFPPRVLDKCYEELIQCDSQLLKLTQSPFPSLNSPYFGSIILDEEATAFETNPADCHQQHILPISPQEAQPFGNAILSTSVVDGDSLHKACTDPIPQDQELAFRSQGHNENANILEIPGPSEVKKQSCELEYEKSNDHSWPIASEFERQVANIYYGLGNEDFSYKTWIANSEFEIPVDMAKMNMAKVDSSNTFAEPSMEAGTCTNTQIDNLPNITVVDTYGPASNANMNGVCGVFSVGPSNEVGSTVNNTGTSTGTDDLSYHLMVPPAYGSEGYCFASNSIMNNLQEVLSAEDRGPIVNNTGTRTHNDYFPNGSMVPPAYGTEEYCFASNSNMNNLQGVLSAEDRGLMVNNNGTSTHNGYFPNDTMAPPSNGSDGYCYASNSNMHALQGVLSAEDRGPMVNNNGTSTHNGYFPNDSMVPPAYGIEGYCFASNSKMNAQQVVLSTEDRSHMVNSNGTSTHNGYFPNDTMAPPANGSEGYCFDSNFSMNALQGVLSAEDKGPTVNNTGTRTRNDYFPNESMVPPAYGIEGDCFASNSNMYALQGVLSAEDRGPMVNNNGTSTHNGYFPNDTMIPPANGSEDYHFASNSSTNVLHGALSAEDRLMLAQAMHYNIPPVHVPVANENLETHLPNNPCYLNP